MSLYINEEEDLSVNPVRCFSCAKVLAHGKNVRYCCLRMIMTSLGDEFKKKEEMNKR